MMGKVVDFTTEKQRLQQRQQQVAQDERRKRWAVRLHRSLAFAQRMALRLVAGLTGLVFKVLIILYRPAYSLLIGLSLVLGAGAAIYYYLPDAPDYHGMMRMASGIALVAVAFGAYIGCLHGARFCHEKLKRSVTK